jgi:hypothetical protein
MGEGWKGVRSTKVAAVWAAVMGMVKTEVVVDDRSGKEETVFYLPLKGVVPGREVDLEKVWGQWKKGDLAKVDPWHPVLCGMRVEHNYEMLLEAQKSGLRLRLVSVDGGYASEYVEGEEPAGVKETRDYVETQDLSLVAALGTLGLPMVGLLGVPGARVYRVARVGHVLRMWPSGALVRWDARVLMERAGPEVLDLKLEAVEPLHPMVSAYNARYAAVKLKRHLGRAKKLVVYRQPRSMRQAVVTENASAEVMERVKGYFRV